MAPRARMAGCVLVGGCLGVLLFVAVAYVAAVPLPAVPDLARAARDVWWSGTGSAPGVAGLGP